jgi:hypothetical protein
MIYIKICIVYKESYMIYIKIYICIVYKAYNHILFMQCVAKKINNFKCIK